MRSPVKVETELTERDLARLARSECDARVRQRIPAIRLIVMGRTAPHAAPVVGIKGRQVRKMGSPFYG